MTGIILMIACKCIDEIKSSFFLYIKQGWKKQGSWHF